jgi:type IV pilus biogenesis protein CpaD/CtpE
LTASHRLARRGVVLATAATLLALGGCAGDRSTVPASSRLEGPAEPLCRFADLATTSTALPKEGCVNAANLARMVADPRDLVQGRPLGDADGARASLAIETYKKGPPAASIGPGGGASAGPSGGAMGGGPQ